MKQQEQRSAEHRSEMGPAAPLRLMAEAVVHHRAGNLRVAESLYRTVLAYDAAHVDALQLLGALNLRQGRAAAAVQMIGRALGLAPASFTLHGNIGNALKQLGRRDQALSSYRRALALDPSHADTLSNMGHLVEEMGMAQTASALYLRAVLLKPDFVQARVNFGNALWASMDLSAAARQYEEALRLQPDHGGAQSNMGAIFLEIRRTEEAAHFTRRALCLEPEIASAWGNLAMIRAAAGFLEEGLSCFRRSLLVEEDAGVRSNYLFYLSHGTSLSAAECFAEHRSFSDRHEQEQMTGWPAHANSAVSDRRLRVGLVSADFRDHPVARLLLPLAEIAGRSAGLELIAYSNHPREDSTTERLRACMAAWVSVWGLDDVSLAARIIADRIDILIDLSGHTRGNRLPVFARKPAPVQASWLGYPATTGLQSMDYYLADQLLAPPGSDLLFSEKIIRLPAVCRFETDETAPSIGESPALRTGQFTFGSLNRAFKLSDAALDLWSRVLLAVPGSRLLIGDADDDVLRANLRGRFEARSIAPERLEFCGRLGLRDYQLLHHRIDLMLDSFPYGGGTTSAHAVWMGVPVLTLAGTEMPSRQTASLLLPLGLDDFVAESEEAFIAAARRWSSDLPALDALRQGMRQRIAGMPSVEAAPIADAFQRALRRMWEIWCSGQAPESFEVAA